MSETATTPGPRMTLTDSEYKKAKALLENRPDRLRDLNIDSDERFPWDNPDQVPGVDGISVRSMGGAADPSTGARACPSQDLIEFLINAQRSHSTMPVLFSNYYVRYWLELEKRVKLFDEDKKPEEDRARLAEIRAQEAEERAKRGEKRAIVGLVVGILGLLIAAITLALSFFLK